MTLFILSLLISVNVFANEVETDRNSYGAFTAPRDISLFEEDSGAILADGNGLFCFMDRADYDAEDDKVLIKKGTVIIFGDYQAEGDHSSGLGVSWAALNIPQINRLECWLENHQEGLELLDIIAEIYKTSY